LDKNKFLEDLAEVYEFLNAQKTNINKLISYLENNEIDKLTIIDEFANTLGLELDNDLRFALVTRLVSLRDDSLVQVLKKQNKNDEEIIELQEKAYGFVRDFWQERHKTLVDYIKNNNLLTPFYQEVFQGVYNVGVKMSVWQSSWTAHIINGVNKDLMNQFDGDLAKVCEYLENNGLYDIGHNEMIADRYAASIDPARPEGSVTLTTNLRKNRG